MIKGNGNKDGLYSVLLRDYNAHGAAMCMNRLAKLSARWIGNHGFSIGIDDVQPGKELVEKKRMEIEKGYGMCETYIASYNNGELELKPGCDAAQTLEAHITNELNDIREKTGQVCTGALPWRNSPLIMSQCGSKGSVINISQMIACVGQQSVGGRRAPNGFIDRSLPHFPRKSKLPAAKGFVASSFYEGLTATEFFFHTMGGREGLVDTAVKTADTGYMSRRLMKALEDLSVLYDKTVRNASSCIVQFVYGDDGMDPSQMEGKESHPLNFNRLFMKVKATCPPGEDKGLSPSEILQVVNKRLSEHDMTPSGGCSEAFCESLKEFLQNESITSLERTRRNLKLDAEHNAADNCEALESIALNISGVTHKQLQVFLETCISRYHAKKVEAGTAIGAIGAQSIGEPGTQMTLKTFHFAGVASMSILVLFSANLVCFLGLLSCYFWRNYVSRVSIECYFNSLSDITLGVPRIKEIINAAKKISTPIITAPLTCDDNPAVARIVKGRIEKTLLGQVAKSIKIVMGSRSASIEIVLDMETIQASFLCIDAYTVKESILQTPRMKLKEHNIMVLNPRKLIVIPQVDRSKILFELQHLKNKLPTIVVKGISTVERAVINNENGKYNLLVEGTGLQAVMGTAGVDGFNTTSNHIMEVNQVLGIEAARRSIVNEIQYTMSSHKMRIDLRHMMLLADLMTFKGEVLGITRFGVQKMKDSVLTLASFEKTADHLFNAAVSGRDDKIEGVSECIIMGIPMQMGTGMFKVRQRNTRNTSGVSSSHLLITKFGKGRYLPMEPVMNPTSEISELQADPVPFARSYQLEALETAIRQNTIVFLETGSGKTLIAIMLLRSFAHLIRKPSPYIAVFLVPTVVLVTQQGEAIRKHTDLRIGKYWGEMGVDYWDAKMWMQQVQNFEVLIMTPAILLAALRHSFIGIDMIKILIFDECHNARGKHPYSCIMTVYTCASESVLAEYIAFPTAKVKTYSDVDVTYSMFGSISCDVRSLRAEAAESLSCDDKDSFLWGKLDLRAETISRGFSLDAAKIFSDHMPSGAQWDISNDLQANKDAGYITSKVLSLVEILLSYRNIKDLRCIIFVERVITAIVLQSLLNELLPRLTGWKTEYTAGNTSVMQPQSRKVQNKIVEEFRKGMVNIIVATSMLEEGLDVQSCNLVIRFDPSATVCSFIQSRGRARMQNSDFILMVRSGDRSTLAQVNNYLASGEIMRKESLRHASLPCSPLDCENDEYSYRVESTGAVVNLRSSVSLLYLYCSKLPSDRYFKPVPMCDIDKEQKICTLNLPRNCQIQTVRVQGDANILKQLACLEACKQLHQAGALTDNLVPNIMEETEVIEESGSVLYNDEQARYFPPELIGCCGKDPEASYHCYLIELQHYRHNGSQLQNIILAVRTKLGFSREKLNFELNVEGGCQEGHLLHSGLITLTSERIHRCRMFQAVLLRALLHHNLNNLEEVSDQSRRLMGSASFDCLLLPSVGSSSEPSVDWKTIDSLLIPSEKPDNKHTSSCPMQGCNLVHSKNGLVFSCWLENSLVCTPHNGKVYYTTGYLHNLDGNSSLKMRNKGSMTYKEYFKKRHNIDLLFEREMLLDGKYLPTVQNYLRRCSPLKSKEPSNSSVELPPEFCFIVMSLVPYVTLCSFTYVPSIMHRIESLLVAVNLKKMVQDHCMQNVSIPTAKGFIRTEPFDPKAWPIPCDYSLPLNLDLETLSPTSKMYTMGMRNIKGKRVADVAEALIGAYVSTAGEQAALSFMTWLGLEIQFVKVPRARHFPVNAEKFVNVHHFENLLKYKFCDPSLLIEALTHGSFMLSEIPLCYQRLEFIGDAVLDYVITTYLYYKYPGLSPGLLTDLRSCSVNNDCYALCAIKADLQKHILYASNDLHGHIASTVESVTQLSISATFGWELDTSFPKVLGDVIESLAGAIFIDSGFNKDKVAECIVPLLEPMVTPETVRLHPARELNELCQRKNYAKKKCVTRKDGVACIGVEVDANGSIYSHTCSARDKRTAEKLACMHILKKLKEEGGC
nr:endoribonuclease Dicer homolog 2-like [Ipomoea batatas]